MRKKISLEQLFFVLAAIELLLEELLDLNEKGFPLNETGLFYKKCVHLKQALGVFGPFLQKETEFSFEYTAVLVKENFEELHAWLLALKYRFALESRLYAGHVSRMKKSFELSIPSLLKIGFEEK